MPTNAAVAKRDLAEIAGRALIATSGVLGVCVFGSVARGQANENSDIDVLVLGIELNIDVSELYEAVPTSVQEAGLAIVYFTPDTLVEHLHSAGVFGMHLRSDGWIVQDTDGVLANLLEQELPVRPRREVRTQLKLLRALRHTERFGGRFLFPLSHVYRIGRTITYAQLVDRGLVEFDQKQAFRLLAELVPSWERAIATIERLEPFYSKTRNRESTLKPPFDPNGPGAEGEFLDAYRVTTIAGAGDEE